MTDTEQFTSEIKIADQDTVVFGSNYIIIKKVYDKWGTWIGILINTPEASYTAVEIEGKNHLDSQKIVSQRPDQDKIFIHTWDCLGG